MTINEMRTYILNHYPNATPLFREIVATGPTRRVVAIYEWLVKKDSTVNPYIKETLGKDLYHQMDMFEYMVTLNKKGNTTEVKI